MDNTPKIFTKKTILFATFLGGPLVAGFLIYKNYKILGKEESAQKALIIGIVCTVLLFAGIFIIPSSVIEKFPNTLIPFIYTGIIALIINKNQDNLINDYLKNGGSKASNWVAARYSLIGLVIILIFIIPVAISLPQNGYEKELNIYDKAILHSSKKLDSKIPDKISESIRQSQFMDVKQKSDLFLNESDSQYILKFIITDFNLLSDSTFLHDFNLFEKILNTNAKLDKKITIRFTNPMLTKTQNLPYVPINEPTQTIEIPKPYEELSNLQRFQVNFFQTIYYNQTVPASDVEIIAESIRKLKTYFPENQKLDIVFTNDGDHYTTKFFIRPDVWDNFPFTDKLRSTIEYFKNSGIKKEIKIVIINNQDYREKEI
jgi:hypothetical protein